MRADLIVEGTNQSDLGDHRPGLQAIREAQVRSPFIDLGVTKQQIRELAISLGLTVSDKPSMACLASRFPYGTRITAEKLKRVSAAEAWLRDQFKFSQLRVRDHEGLARIEVGKDERAKLLSIDAWDAIHTKLRELGYKYVTIDLVGYRTGSLNEILSDHELPAENLLPQA